MTFLLAMLAVGGSLLFQAAVGQWVPGAERAVDALLWPVAYYALARSQRSAMIVGCAAGLVQDAWFEAGSFGVHGFAKTLLGWAIGGLGSRFDLNHLLGQFFAGAVLYFGDRLVEMGLMLLLDLEVSPFRPAALVAAAAVNGLLVSAVFAFVRRAFGRDSKRPVRRRA